MCGRGVGEWKTCQIPVEQIFQLKRLQASQAVEISTCTGVVVFQQSFDGQGNRIVDAAAGRRAGIQQPGYESGSQAAELAPVSFWRSLTWRARQPGCFASEN